MNLVARRPCDWYPDLPDPRDLTAGHDEVVKALLDLKPESEHPTSVDWREYCLPVDDQLSLRSSSAFACASLLQYFERRSSGRMIEPSAMFIYWTTRRLMGWTGDSGAQLRMTWKAIARFGFAAEKDWPYRVCSVDSQPDNFAFSSAEKPGGLRYVRLDVRGERGEETLRRVKSYLAAGFACAFGFPGNRSLMTEAEIPMPNIHDTIEGGHSVMAVGYDDNRRFRSYRGALLIRNSWGAEWAEGGYGWLPYAYVREELAADFWTLLSPDWMQSGEFHRPAALSRTG